MYICNTFAIHHYLSTVLKILKCAWHYVPITLLLVLVVKHLHDT